MSTYLYPTKHTRNEIDRALRHWHGVTADQIDVTVMHYNRSTYFQLWQGNHFWDVLVVRAKLSATKDFDRLEAIRFYVDNHPTFTPDRSM